MTSGDFYRKLKKLNKSLKITCFDGNKPAGLWLDYLGNYIEICGVDKNTVPMRSIFDEQGHIVKGGWLRVLHILVARKLVDKKQAEKVFDFHFGLQPISVPPANDPILRQIDDITARVRARGKYDEDGNLMYKRQDLLYARDVMASKR